jgi:hypothetical protein
MSSPERLNVLLSRARMGLIIIGNSDTFLKSRSGRELWAKFFDMIKGLGYFYDGMPVQCGQHDDVKNVVRLPEEFSKLCPDGGCTEPWFVPFLVFVRSADHWALGLSSGAMMSCGIHSCPRKCHKQQDHGRAECVARVQTSLPCGHSVTRSCHRSQVSLDRCPGCKLAQRKAAGVEIRGDDTRTSEPRSPPPDPRTPTSSTSPWRMQTATTTGDKEWRNVRSITNSSSETLPTYSGRGRGTYKGGFINRPKPQYDSFFVSGGGSGGGNWRK